MCLVGSRQSNDERTVLQEGQKVMSSPSASQNNDSNQPADNQHRDYCYTKYVPIDSTEFEPRPSRNNEIPDGVAINNKLQSFNEAIVTCATAKKLTKVDKKTKSNHPIIVVQHNYHDHSQENENDRQRQQKARGGVAIPFPLKLHYMLNKAMTEGHGGIISWQPHGRCFVVYRARDFQDIVLPKYFNLRKISSFQRQLNLYGFQRLTLGRDRGGYYHELFLRNKEFLARDIKRVQVKGTGVRARSNPEQEPNFYTMQYCEPTESPPSSEDISEGTTRADEIKRRMPSTWSAPSPREESVSHARSPVPILRPIQPIATISRHHLADSNDGIRDTSTNNFDARHHSYIDARHHSYIDVRQHSSYRDLTRGGVQEEKTVPSFVNKAFHYLDPFQPIGLGESKNDANNEIVTNGFDARTFEHFLDRL